MSGRSHDGRFIMAVPRAPLARVFGALLATSALAAPVVGQQGRDSTAILNYVGEYQRTWNTRDAAGVAAFFTEDADLVMGNMPAAQGRMAIQDWWRQYFDAQEPGRQGTFDVTSLKVLGPGVAIVDVKSTTGGTGRSNEPLVSRYARGTWLVARRDGRWQIAAMRGLPTEEDEVELNPSEAAALDLRPHIRAFVAAYEDAFNRHDPDALSALFSSDADMVIRELPAVRGIQAIRDYWSTYFTEPRPYYALMVIDQIRMVSADVALVNVIGTGAPFEHTAQVEALRTARGTWILTRANGEWRMASLRVLPSEADRVIRTSTR